MWTHGTHSTELQVQRNGLSVVWQKRSHSSSLPREEINSEPLSKHHCQQTQRLSKTPALEEEEDTSLYNTSTTPARANALVVVELTVHGTLIRMELDTESALLIIPDCLYRHNLRRLLLSPTSVVLGTYSGERIIPLGKITVNIEYISQHC